MKYINILGQHFLSFHALIRSGFSSECGEGQRFHTEPNQGKKGGRRRAVEEEESICLWLWCKFKPADECEACSVSPGDIPDGLCHPFLSPACWHCQLTDCSFGTPLMPRTKEELSRGQCQCAKVRAAASSLSRQTHPLFLTHVLLEHSVLKIFSTHKHNFFQRWLTS